jgi:hypothetical protein
MVSLRGLSYPRWRKASNGFKNTAEKASRHPAEARPALPAAPLQKQLPRGNGRLNLPHSPASRD